MGNFICNNWYILYTLVLFVMATPLLTISIVKLLFVIRQLFWECFFFTQLIIITCVSCGFYGEILYTGAPRQGKYNRHQKCPHFDNNFFCQKLQNARSYLSTVFWKYCSIIYRNLYSHCSSIPQLFVQEILSYHFLRQFVSPWNNKLVQI